MGYLASSVQVYIDAAKDGWQIEMRMTIQGQVYTCWHEDPAVPPYFQPKQTVEEAVASALIKLGNYIEGYERRKRFFEETFDSCWRD